MDHNIKNKGDSTFEKVLSSTKLQASENLKFRIMQQINTEHALAYKKVKVRKKSSVATSPNIFRVFSFMYLVLALIIGGTYIYVGKSEIMSPTIWKIGILVIVITSVFLIISFLDSQLNFNQKHKTN